MSETILFFGNERLATGVFSQTPVFKSLIAMGYKIPAIIVSQNNPSVGRNGRELEIVDVAKSNNIEVLYYKSLKDAASELASYNAQAAVLVAYGKIIPSSVLEIFPVGIINVHPSLLPKHRGPTPIESTIMAGDQKTGVSIMKIGPQMDSGPIYTQSSLDLNGRETKQQLADKLNLLGSHMITKHLRSIIDGSLTPKDQPTEGATYDKLITKQDGVIDWDQPAQLIERQIRAFSLWPKSKTMLGNVEVIVLESHVIEGRGQHGSIFIDSTQNQLGVYAADKVLILDKLLPLGKKEMTGQSFIAGYRSRL